MRPAAASRAAAGLLLVGLLAACAEGSVADRELQSLQARMRMGVGDLGPRQELAATKMAALPAEARRHRVGDRLLYSDGRVEVVTAAEGLVVTFDEGMGQSRTQTVNPAFPFFSRTTGRYDRLAEIGGDPPEGLWPLGRQGVQGYNAVVLRTERETGQAQRFRSRLECETRAPATIETPLGRFSTLPVECRVFSGRRLTPRGSERFDMVPALGHFVRHVETDQGGVVEREVYLLGIEPGPWLDGPARRRLGEQLRAVLERQPSGEVVPFADRASGLTGFMMAAATFADPARPGEFCRAYTITLAAAAGVEATDYPGRSCRIAGSWRLPEGF